MKFVLSLFLFLLATGIHAQDIICVSPFHLKNVKFGSSIHGILRKNDLSKDTVILVLNQKIVQGLQSKFPETEFVIADSAFLKILADSAKLREMRTSSSLDVINGVAGSINTPANKKSPTAYYDGLNMNAGGVLFSKAVMQNKNAKFFVVLTEFEAATDFIIHFELYDKYFTKLYGDKFVRPSYSSGKMYFSTFLYYFDTYLKSFNEELVKKIKVANTIINP